MTRRRLALATALLTAALVPAACAEIGRAHV